MAKITPKGIIQIENKFKNNIGEVLDFLKRIKDSVPFL